MFIDSYPVDIVLVIFGTFFIKFALDITGASGIVTAGITVNTGLAMLPAIEGTFSFCKFICGILICIFGNTEATG